MQRADIFLLHFVFRKVRNKEMLYCHCSSTLLSNRGS